jgi:hypothetical protein
VWRRISERHFRRLRDNYEADGAEGLIDRRRGRGSGGPSRPDRVIAKGVHDPPLRLQRQALPRADQGPGEVRVRLQLDQDPAAEVGPGEQGQVAIVPPQEAAAAALAGHDAAPGRSPFRWIPSLDRDFDLIATHGRRHLLPGRRGRDDEHVRRALRGRQPTQVCREFSHPRIRSGSGIQHIPSYSPEARGRAPLTEAGTDRRPGADAHERKQVAQLRSAASPVSSWTAYRPTTTPQAPQMCYQNRTS